MESIQAKPKTDWCHECVNRVGSRKFRQLTINKVCQECDKYVTPKPKPLPELKPVPEPKQPLPKQLRKRYPSVAEKEKTEIGRAREQKKIKIFREQEKQLIRVFDEL